MGCYNAKCGVSGLPITEGEECYFLPIFGKKDRYRSTEYGGGCYHTDEWDFGMLPILGEYDGYGGIEEINEEFYKNYLKFIEKNYQLTADIQDLDDGNPAEGLEFKFIAEDLKKIPFCLSSELEELDMKSLCDSMERIGIRWYPDIKPATNVDMDLYDLLPQEKKELIDGLFKNTKKEIPEEEKEKLRRMYMENLLSFDSKFDRKLSYILVKKSFVEALKEEYADIKFDGLMDSYAGYRTPQYGKLILLKTKHEEYSEDLNIIMMLDRFMARMNVPIQPQLNCGQDVPFRELRVMKKLSAKEFDDRLTHRLSYEDISYQEVMEEIIKYY